MDAIKRGGGGKTGTKKRFLEAMICVFPVVNTSENRRLQSAGDSDRRPKRFSSSSSSLLKHFGYKP